MTYRSGKHLEGISTHQEVFDHVIKVYYRTAFLLNRYIHICFSGWIAIF